MNRKNFFKKIGLGILAGSGIVPFLQKDQPPIEEDCKITGKDILGPYFIADTSNVVNLNTRNLPGIPMRMIGKVYSGEGTNKPIKGAKIEIWHADSKGVYHPEGSGDVDDYLPSEITLRGFVLTEEDGSFAFQSIRPGLYGRRARHLHYKITCPNHKELVTQSYFQDDARLTQDVFSRKAGDCRIINYTNDGNGGILGVMNFNLKRV